MNQHKLLLTFLGMLVVGSAGAIAQFGGPVMMAAPGDTVQALPQAGKLFGWLSTAVASVGGIGGAIRLVQTLAKGDFGTVSEPSEAMRQLLGQVALSSVVNPAVRQFVVQSAMGEIAVILSMTKAPTNVMDGWALARDHIIANAITPSKP